MWTLTLKQIIFGIYILHHSSFLAFARLCMHDDTLLRQVCRLCWHEPQGSHSLCPPASEAFDHIFRMSLNLHGLEEVMPVLKKSHPWDLHHTSWRPWINSFWTSSRPQWQTLSSLPTNNIDSINWSASPIDFIFLVYSYIFLLFVPELW